MALSCGFPPERAAAPASPAGGGGGHRGIAADPVDRDGQAVDRQTAGLRQEQARRAGAGRHSGDGGFEVIRTSAISA